jgi:predicted nucleotidyltransferase
VSLDVASLTMKIEVIAQAHPQLRLLVLHGSRARGDAHEGSDWDFAYLADSGLDPSLLYADLALQLASDRVDLVDLATAGGLIRYRVARDGVVLFEAGAGTFDKFWLEAVTFWCDAEPVLRAGYDAVLAGLDP